MPTNFALLFLQASISCAISGALAWALLKLAARLWPALAMQRSVWLLSQTAIACVFLLTLLPHSSSFSVLPAIEIDHAAKRPPAPSLIASHDAPETAAVDQEPGESAWLSTVAQAWLMFYCAGLIVTAARWMLARRRLHVLLASSRALSAGELASHAPNQQARCCNAASRCSKPMRLCRRCWSAWSSRACCCRATCANSTNSSSN